MERKKRYRAALTCAVAAPVVVLVLLFTFSRPFRARVWLGLFDCGVISEDAAHERLVAIGKECEEVVLAWLSGSDDYRMGLLVLSYVPDCEVWLEAMVSAVARGDVVFNSPFISALQQRAREEDLPRVMDLLDHPSDDVKVFAVMMMTQMSVFYSRLETHGGIALPVAAPGIETAVRRVAASPVYSKKVRDAAGDVLGRLSYGGPEGESMVSAALRSSDGRARLTAVAIVKEKGGACWAERLAAFLLMAAPELLDDEVREAALQVLRDERYARMPTVRDALEEEEQRGGTVDAARAAGKDDDE